MVYTVDDFKYKNAFEVRSKEEDLIYLHHRNVFDWTHKSFDAPKMKLKLGLNVQQGKKRGGVPSKYVISGLWKNSLGKDVDTYQYKPSDNNNIIENIEEKILHLNFLFLKIVRDNLPKTELEIQRLMKKIIQVKSICNNKEGGVQFSIGCNYWSVYHIDHDVAYSVLGVFCKELNNKNILYFFMFPDYKIKVPMRNGNLLVFNPYIYHCCTIPLYHNLLILSQYIIEQTILPCAACHYDV